MQKADLILWNGKVFSVNEENQVFRAEAVAVREDRILAAGSNRDIWKLRDEDTIMVDCEGRTILPGLCDAHCHGSMAAGIFAACQLFDVCTGEGEGPEEEIAEIVQRLADFAAEHPDAAVIRGIGWNQAHFNGSEGIYRKLSRKDLDAVSLERPVVLESFCQHAVWTNTAAIRKAGLSEKTHQPGAGFFETEEGGYPSGVFHESDAIGLIKKRLPGYDYSVEEYKNVILAYQENCVLPYGVMMVNECKLSDNAIAAYQELARDNRLKMRVRAVYDIEHPDKDEEVEHVLLRKGKDDVGDLFRIPTVKLFLEGFFAMEEPFDSSFNQKRGLSENYAGECFFTDDVLTACFEKLLRAGFQIHLHAMGDRSVHQGINCLQKAQEETGIRNRNVIAHVMCIGEKYKKKMARSGLIASLQPRWMVFDADVEGYEVLLGTERAERVFPDRSLSDAGCKVAYGTDFPVTPSPNPFHGIQCAMTRRVFPGTADYERLKNRILGPGGDGSADRVSLAEAVQRSSLNGAYQMFLERETGSIEPGKSADLVILDCDLENLDPEKIYSVKVRQSYFRGKKIYEARRGDCVTTENTGLQTGKTGD